MKSLLKNRALMLAAAIAWTILIFIGCSLPGKDLPPISLFDHFDKIVHFVFFFIFALVWMLAIGRKGLQTKHYMFIILISVCYGFALEYYQVNFVAGRSWDVWDGVADGIGAVVACLFARKML